MKATITLILAIFLSHLGYTQIERPEILEVLEDDRVATIYWNSKTDSNDADQDKGIFSYLVEWGPVEEGFIYNAITPYRVHMCQALEPGVNYQARIYALDTLGRKSLASEYVNFQHDDAKVKDMRSRLNGFFDDFNESRGGFEERNWNQSYTGCMQIGKVSQHINDQYHGHNVIASGYCDRAAASSRVRYPFDFENRTGVIEFDLDGSQRGRQFWYLDLLPFERKRDLTGHIDIGISDPDGPADPPHLLRIAQIGNNIEVQIADDQGRLFVLADQYRDDACGSITAFCEGENLDAFINVRKHWRIELSKTDIRIFINGIKVVDGNLVTDDTPEGLAFETAQVNWLLFSYNTIKDNYEVSMIHWDNFGFDAPEGYQQNTVIHNYTDGELGTRTGRTGNDFSVGSVSSIEEPALFNIPIPDQILDQNGQPPIKADLMFTIQGSDYEWLEEEFISVNGRQYSHPEPSSENPDLEVSDIVQTLRPYSAVLALDPADLIEGNNEINFHLNNPRLLNVHIELEYPIESAPNFTPPMEIFSDHMSELMGFREFANQVGPGIVFRTIGETPFWTLESEYFPEPDIQRWYIYEAPVSETLDLDIIANSEVQLAATGKVSGINYYEIWIDKEVVRTIRVDEESPVAAFRHRVTLDVSDLENGQHELYIQAYDVNGNPSLFDAFSANATSGLYMPTIFNVDNVISSSDEFAFDKILEVYPNPTDSRLQISGNLSDFHVYLTDVNGKTMARFQSLDSDLTIDLSNHPDGLYCIHALNKHNGSNQIFKIVKQ